MHYIPIVVFAKGIHAIHMGEVQFAAIWQSDAAIGRYFIEFHNCPFAIGS